MAIAAAPTVDLERFRAEGYLVVEGVFDPERDLDPVVDEYEQRLDEVLAGRVREGTISSAFDGMPFMERWARYLNEAGTKGIQPFDISLPFSGVTEATPIHLGPAVFGLLVNPKLIDAVEQVVGPEVLSNPIQHVRIKPPESLLPPEFRNSLVGQTDWHQDQGVALPEVDETEMLTVWLPVTDANEENGCLCVVPESHTLGLVTHCPGKAEGRKALHIPDEIRGSHYVPVPMRRGDVLFMHRRTMHASLRNKSDRIRWSFDLRYQPVGQPTGRPWFPSFVVRSRQRPESEVRDWQQWAALWRETRSQLAATPPQGKFNRWTGQEPACA